ncbi:MAG: glycine--tRNA ligase [Firmicutes bacterium]|nr:glycine--tRNA ligase [Bacillota bacterium]
MKNVSMETMVSYCNRYGFVFQGSEIYGGLANTWDYGPLGSLLKENIKNAWRYFFIQNGENSYELDAGILMNPQVWQASGHLDGFSDPLLDCKNCKTRHRPDNLINDFDSSAAPDSMTQQEMLAYIMENNILCPKCEKSDFTDIRQFNLMFSTQRGVTQDKSTTIYLRPETAQGKYVNFLNVLRTTRAKLPFSVGAIGKVFRNEITPGNFIFRTIEFEQMEYQVFCKKGEDESLYDYYKQRGVEFFELLGIDESRLRFHDHEKLAHYAKAACDIEYAFPFGWGEINGTHNRTDFDLGKHQEHSGKNMTYFDEKTGEHFVPYIVESCYGLGRTFLAVLFETLEEEVLDNDETRLVLRLKPFLAPYKVNILPLTKNKHGDKAKEIHALLKKYFMVNYDDAGSIGKRYRRGDAIGTPFAVTIDNNTLENNVITLRERDSMKQIDIPVCELVQYLAEKIFQ